MARGKKKESALTPEEKLAQALVPDWEQPYKAPTNWCWVRQNNVCSLSDGEKRKNEDFPYWEAKALRGTKEIQYVSEGKFVAKGTKVILVDGENSGEVFDVPTDGYMGSTFKALQISATIHWDYLRFFISTKQELYRNNKKGSAIPHLNKELFFNLPLPLAPKGEQARIVDRIEYLFAKLDEAKEKAQSVLDSFETRKAAILHKAFTGELTAKWRAEQRVSFETWKSFPLAEIATVVSGYAFSSKDFCEENTVPCIKITNVGVGEYVADDYEFLPESYLEEYERFAVKKGDILISLTRSFINAGLKVCICEEERVSLLNQRVALIKDCNIGYIFYYLRSDDVLRYVKEKSKTTNQPNLSIKDLNSMLIAVPCADEQAEIVRILDSLFAKEQQAKEAAEAVLEKIDLLKKSILARAFRGELGTNDPAEPSAIELIKQILSEKIVVTEPQKPRKIKTPEVDFVAKTIMQALASGKKLTPEKLKAETDLQIDDFYDQLKILIDNGQVVETRVDGEAYLEASNADRQPNN